MSKFTTLGPDHDPLITTAWNAVRAEALKASGGRPVPSLLTAIDALGNLLEEWAMRGLTAAACDVLSERRRQIEVEGWTPEHDDEHSNGSMAVAAAAYATWAEHRSGLTREIWSWTGWAERWFNSKDRRRDLVRAAALLIAEIERLDRTAAKAKHGDMESRP